MLCNAFIYPLLLYGITSWALTYSSSLDAPLALQNKFVKIIHFSDQCDSPHPLFISSNILKINELHKLQLESFVYESSLQQIHVNFIIMLAIFQKFIPMQQGQSTDQELFIPHKNTTQYGLFSVRYAEGSLWNSIPKDLRSS